MCAEIDEVRRDLNGAKGGFHDRVRDSAERQHRPVVVGIH